MHLKIALHVHMGPFTYYVSPFLVILDILDPPFNYKQNKHFVPYGNPLPPRPIT